MLAHLAIAVAVPVCLSAAPPPHAAAVPPGWQQFVASEGGFEALFPGAPLRQDVPAGPQRLQVYGLKRADAEFWVNVMIVEAPDSVAGVLDESVRRMTSRKDVRVLHDERRTRQGYPARESHLKTSGGAVAFLWVARDDRMYQLAVKVVGDGPLPHADVRTFFDSFGIVQIVSRPRQATIMLAQWKEYTPRGGRFAVRFPAEPTEGRSQNDEATTSTWSSEADQVAYTVTVIQFAGAADLPAGLLDAMIDGTVDKVRHLGTMTKGPRLTVSGLPAQDLTVEGKGGHMTFRFVVAKDRLYQLTAIAAGARYAPPGETRFLTSFRPQR